MYTTMATTGITTTKCPKEPTAIGIATSRSGTHIRTCRMPTISIIIDAATRADADSLSGG
jgi:hypothetical protein